MQPPPGHQSLHREQLQMGTSACPPVSPAPAHQRDLAYYGPMARR